MSYSDEEEYYSSAGEDPDDRPVGEVIKAQNPGIQKASIAAGKSQIVDMLGSHQTVFCNFYKDAKGRTFVNIPKLPHIAGGQTVIPSDYWDYAGRFSTWYNNAEKRFKSSNKKPPAEKKPFQCDECEWSFTSTQRLVRHKDTHTDMGTFACQVCHSLFNHQYNMYHHWRNTCVSLNNRRTDVELSTAELTSLRNYVLCVMGMENRAQLFHVTGGSMYLPSDQFINDPHNVNIQIYSSPCHMCSLYIPTKFMECHGDVHRGRFRIDGPIQGEFYCHVCSKLFRKKENLILHWRHFCADVMAHTSDEVLLDDDEMTALAWLVLQQAVPACQIDEMGRNTQQMVDRWMLKHAKDYGQKGLSKLYYHFPQEIWPLDTHTNVDVITDAIQIVQHSQIDSKSSKISIHRANLLASCSPEFYATGMVWNQFCTSTASPEDLKGTYRVVLRYTMKESVIGTYKFTRNTCPRLRPACIKHNTELQQEFKCTRCENTKKNKHALQFASQARLDDHTEMFHVRISKRWDHHCILCRRIMYLRSPEEHWEYDCQVIEQFIEDPADRKYVDFAYAQILHKQVFSSKMKVVLKPPAGFDQALFDKRKKKGANDGYFMKKGADYVEKMETQKDEIRVVIENLGKMESMRIHVAPEFEKAKMRYAKLRNPADGWEPPKMTIVICPHCGGRVHYSLLTTHLEHRHFYPKTWHALGVCVARWKNEGFKNPIPLFNQLLSESDYKVSPLMTYQRYRTCYAYNFGNTPQKTVMFDSIWQQEPTLRYVEINEPLVINDHELLVDTFTADAIVAPEPPEDLDMYIPPVEHMGGDEDGETDNVWMPEDPNLVIVEVPKYDAFTRLPLSEELARLQTKQDNLFFGDYLRAAHSNGIKVTTLADMFCHTPLSGKRKLVGFTESDLQNDQVMDEEMIKKCLEDDLKVVDSEDSENGNDIRTDDEEDPLPKPAEGQPALENQETHARRKRIVRRERRKQKRISTFPDPKKYDRTKNGPLPTVIRPSKNKEMKHLSLVTFEETDEEDEKVDSNIPLPLSMTLENHRSDFRVSADNFYTYMMTAMGKPLKVDAKNVGSLSQRELEGLVQFDEVVPNCNQTQAVTDQLGNLYIGGYVVPDSFEKDHRKKFYMEKGGKAKHMQVFRSSDKFGQFKYIWPVEPTSKISEVPDIKLARASMAPAITITKMPLPTRTFREIPPPALNALNSFPPVAEEDNEEDLFLPLPIKPEHRKRPHPGHAPQQPGNAAQRPGHASHLQGHPPHRPRPIASASHRPRPSEPSEPGPSGLPRPGPRAAETGHLKPSGVSKPGSSGSTRPVPPMLSKPGPSGSSRPVTSGTLKAQQPESSKPGPSGISRPGLSQPSRFEASKPSAPSQTLKQKPPGSVRPEHTIPSRPVPSGSSKIPSKSSEPVPGTTTNEVPSTTSRTTPYTGPIPAKRARPDSIQSPESVPLPRPKPSTPGSSQPASSKPEAAKPKPSQPASFGPVAAKPKPSQPASFGPVAAKPKPSEPASSGPGAAKPKASQPASFGSETSKPKPSQPASSGSEAAKVKPSQPASSGPEAAKVKPSQPASSGPETSKPKPSQPASSRPGPSKSAQSKPETSKQQPPKPAPSKSGSSEKSSSPEVLATLPKPKSMAPKITHEVVDLSDSD